VVRSPAAPSAIRLLGRAMIISRNASARSGVVSFLLLSSDGGTVDSISSRPSAGFGPPSRASHPPVDGQEEPEAETKGWRDTFKKPGGNEAVNDRAGLSVAFGPDLGGAAVWPPSPSVGDARPLRRYPFFFQPGRVATEGLQIAFGEVVPPLFAGLGR
jgi:hypothetical protein